ncbi:pilin [Microbulbifer thermotolerans]|nr:pilin [Microbulbifer thermotolerans]
MSEAMGFVAAAKAAVAEAYQTLGTLPSDNTEAGLDSTASNIQSKYVESVTVNNGVITVAIQGTGDSTLDGGSVILTPVQGDGSTSLNSSYTGPLGWKCTVSSTSIAKFFPASCRSS